MRNTNKKGFTVVELVIVIAVIAILAAVLIPTFAGIIHKANIATDTAVAKNLNTAAISAGAKDFDSAIEAVKDAGYLLANLNAKADGCYFVWDDVNNQFLLVDTKNDYKVIYSNTEASAKSATNWLVAVSDPEAIAAITAAGCGVKQIATDYEDLMANLAAGGEVYVDESVVLTNDNLIILNNTNASTTINLGNSQLNTSGMLEDVVPVQIKQGTVNINGGIIGAAGSYIDSDGKLVNTPIKVSEGSTVKINGTTFNIHSNGYTTFFGNVTVENATYNSKGTTIYCGNNGQVILKNVTVNSSERFVWATNWNGNDHTSGTACITINSGKFSGEGNTSTFAPIASYSGDIVIDGGDFTSNREDGKLFQVMDNNGTITINGGSFNGIAFDKLTVEKVQELTLQGVARETANGFVITLK